MEKSLDIKLAALKKIPQPVFILADARMQIWL